MPPWTRDVTLNSFMKCPKHVKNEGHVLRSMCCNNAVGVWGPVNDACSFVVLLPSIVSSSSAHNKLLLYLENSPNEMPPKTLSLMDWACIHISKRIILCSFCLSHQAKLFFLGPRGSQGVLSIVSKPNKNNIKCSYLSRYSRSLVSLTFQSATWHSFGGPAAAAVFPSKTL